jgi:hypothetical protein
VGTQSEIEDQGRWEADASRCASYESVREKLLAAQIEASQSTAASPAVPRKITELAAR